MNKLLAALALTLGITFGLLSGAAHAAPEVGKAAPDYVFSDINGKEHSIKGFKGKTVVLEWTNPGCPFVKKFYNAGAMQALQANAVKEDVVWVAINSSAKGKEGNLTVDEAKKYFKDHKVNASAYVLDESGAFGKLYGAKTTPHMFVIDKEGKLAYQGAIDSIKSADAADITKADNYVLEALADLKEGKAIKTTSTAPYGCGVKYAD
jgi:peroxiredoxin